jgi:glycosyltransferase involved in cell wall biosynthesis
VTVREPTVSLITVCYNSAATIGETLESVAAQDYPSIEYIVIDGASSDATIDILHRYRDRIDRLISEPDSGIYSAMNKGIALAGGDVIGFINSDDVLANQNAIGEVAAVFQDERVDACYRDLCYVRATDPASIVRYWQSSPFQPGMFRTGWCPPHPTFYVRREVFERCGGFDERFRIASDVELMMRFLEVQRIRSVYVPGMMVRMRIGGESNNGIRNMIQVNREIWKALVEHELRPSLPRFAIGKLLSRGQQFLGRPSRFDRPSPRVA